MIEQTTIDTALSDRQLLGAALGDPTSWTTWLAVLRASFGLPLSDEQREVFATVAGDRPPPTSRVREFWCIAGRRSAKSRMAAALGVFLACFMKYRLAAGETGTVLVLAASQDQAKVVFNYARAFLTESPVLRQEIDSITASEIRLRNGIVIAIHSNSFRTIPGRTLCACIFDEVAKWRDESSATPDIETYRAVLPALLTTKGMLIGISTGYRRTGLLYQKHRDCFGQDNNDILVVQGSTLTFNLTLTEADLAAQIAADPEAAVGEWEGGFRNDLSSLLSHELIDAAIQHGRPLELPPRDFAYSAFTDSAGGVGGGDAYTLCITHTEPDDQCVVDLVRGVAGQFDPQAVTASYAKLIKEYGVHSVTGDAYGAQWVAGAWEACGIGYQKSELTKSEIYLEVLPLFARNLVHLPDHHSLVRELRLLERRTARSGRDSVDHPKGGRDDYANAVCGALNLIANNSSIYTRYDWVGGDQAASNDKGPALFGSVAAVQMHLRSYGVL